MSSYQNKLMNVWNQNELIGWIQSLATDASFSSSVKQQIIDGIKKYETENNSEVTGLDFSEAEDASDIKEMVIGIDSKKSRSLFRKIGDKKQEEFDIKQKEKGAEPGTEGSNDNVFALNVIGKQGTCIPLKGMTKKSTVAQVKAKYLEEEGNQTAADNYRSGKWDSKDGKISLKYGGKSMDNDRTLESYGIVNALGMPPVVGFHVIGGSNESNNTMEQYTQGQLVQVAYCLDDSTIWINAQIVNVCPSYIEVKYLEQVSSYNESSEWIMERDIATKIRPKQQQEQQQEEEQQEEQQQEPQQQEEQQQEPQQEEQQDVTSQFKVEQIVEYKVDTASNKDELWVDATIMYVGSISKFIKIEFKYYDSNGRMVDDAVMVNECEYKYRIRLKTAKISKTASKGGKNKDKGKGKDKDKDKNKDKNKGKGESKDKSKRTIFKKKKAWNEKAIIKWNADDVKSWVESMSSFKQYASSFPKNMDGKELLDTTIDDLTLIIPKKLWRRKFMKQLEIAKQKYIKTSSSNNNQADVGDGDDDEKRTKPSNGSNGSNRSNGSNGSNRLCINGIVGLHNLGNTCYMNTSIQLLSQSPYITRYLRKRAKFCKENAATNGNSGGVLNWISNKWNGVEGDGYINNDYAMLNAWTELCDIIYNRHRSHSYSITTASPANIRDALNGRDTAFGSGRQDDSIRSLDHMLQALDEQIETEIMQKTGKTNIKYKDNIQIFHGKTLTKSEETSYIDELLRDHNPNNSILRKSFDGIERIICECLECNKIFQQFATFRIMDLPVISHEIQFKNINIITSNNHYKLPQISMLDYCSIDLLKYHVIQYLLSQQQENEKQEMDYNNIRIVTISGNNGKLKYINNNDKLSELQEITNANRAILVLVNNKNKHKSNKWNKSSLLQFTLCVGYFKNNNKIKPISVKYNKYNPYTIHELISNEIATYNDDDSDEKYDYYVDYNGHVLTQKELNSETFKQNMHNMNGINLLILLCVNKENKECCYDINDMDYFVKYEAEERYSNCSSSLDALNKLKTWWKNKKTKISKQHINHCKDIENGIDLQLMKINKTMNVLQTKQHILCRINNWICSKYKLSISNTRKLRDLMECLSEYQKEKIMDDASYAYPCPHCNNGSNSRWIKVTKNIVYSPPIFLFHLDRFGKNMKENYDDASYQYNNSYSSNKFEHGINYKLQLNCQYSSQSQKIYNLYGVSNHSGSTNGGHYTATIKCLSDGNWYDISDSFVGNQSVKPLEHSKSATILAYVRDLE